MTVLLDTSFLLAALFERDRNHSAAAAAMRALKSGRAIAEPVLTEIFFVVAARISYDRAIQTFDILQSPAFEIIPLNADDRRRMSTLMRIYRDAKLDVADVAQVAIAEKMQIVTIYTFDRRDFTLIRPQHIPAFTLLP